MFNKDDKRRLYWLIDQYLLNEITERMFCDEYYYCYSLELDYATLTDLEKKAFADLSKVSSRFSEHEEDHRLDARAFFTAQQLRQKIVETKEKLN